jgi:hypothetical protein
MGGSRPGQCLSAQRVGRPSGLGQAVGRGEVESVPARLVEAYPVAHGYEDRLDTRPGPQGVPDHLAVLSTGGGGVRPAGGTVVGQQGRGRAAAGARQGVAERERVLGDTDSGQSGEHPQVAGEAEAPGMSQPVTVADDEVGNSAEAVESGENRGDLAERQQPGYLLEGDGSHGGRPVHDGACAGIEGDGCRSHDTAVVVVGDVHTDDRALAGGRSRFVEAKVGTQPVLSRACGLFIGGPVP